MPFHAFSFPQSRFIEHWPSLPTFAHALAVYEAAQALPGPALVITPDANTATQLLHAITFFQDATSTLPCARFPDWEILPYDVLSPSPTRIAARVALLHDLSQWEKGILIVTPTTLTQKLLPPNHLKSHRWTVQVHTHIEVAALQKQLIEYGYESVYQVTQPGEYSVRGGIIDVFSPGYPDPIRIDLWDDTIESLAFFDIHTQRSGQAQTVLHILTAREYALSPECITQFRQQWRTAFDATSTACHIYKSISTGQLTPGIEAYLPLFFSQPACLMDYLPDSTTVLYSPNALRHALTHYWTDIQTRYEQYRYDTTRPVLAPDRLFFSTDSLFQSFQAYRQICVINDAIPANRSTTTVLRPLSASILTHLPPLSTQASHLLPLIDALHKTTQANRILLCVETDDHRHAIVQTLAAHAMTVHTCEHWHQVTALPPHHIGIYIAPTADVLSWMPPLFLPSLHIAIIALPHLYATATHQTQRKSASSSSHRRTHAGPALALSEVSALEVGTLIVHKEQGIAAYQGLETVKTSEQEAEYMKLQFAGKDVLYVPMGQLHQISRYIGADSNTPIPLSTLGHARWKKETDKARKKAQDVASTLLGIYAKRALATKSPCLPPDETEYPHFCAQFPFTLTPDQKRAITQVIEDMTHDTCMDRLICGDVGFGKTEVALHAAWLAVQNGRQVAVLVPTTLLANQHFSRFQARFAHTPIQIALLTRATTARAQHTIHTQLETGKIDIIIGTHKLLHTPIRYPKLGLLIIDEEHRFGVKQKEFFKAQRAHVDILTLTATPIPRTLHLGLSALRDMSIIATPPLARMPVKTLLSQPSDALFREAITREKLRAGQVYFLHNAVDTLPAMAERLARCVPEAQVRIAHGQMPQKQLEQTMVDFYHKQFDVLVCTTIIESGIDVPNANTLLIHHAQHFGLAQLHQLRGRVGRSEHQAYAYLLTPDFDALPKDAKKRLNAFCQTDSLGAGFRLAREDLEIRGAGALLGDEQSGNMHRIGFSLYMDMLQDAISQMKQKKAGTPPPKPTTPPTDILFQGAALIPHAYISDIPTRLGFYQRLSAITNATALVDLQKEMVERFGLLPPPLKHLFMLTEIRLRFSSLKLQKIALRPRSAALHFFPDTPLQGNAIIALLQKKDSPYRLTGPHTLHYAWPETLQATVKTKNETQRLQAYVDALETVAHQLGATTEGEHNVKNPGIDAP